MAAPMRIGFGLRVSTWLACWSHTSMLTPFAMVHDVALARLTAAAEPPRAVPPTADDEASLGIFVGNLPRTVTHEVLTELLVQMGPLQGEVRLLKDAEGMPKGVAFCDYFDSSSAAYAIQVLNGLPFGGRPLRVNAQNSRPAARGPPQPFVKPVWSQQPDEPAADSRGRPRDDERRDENRDARDGPRRENDSRRDDGYGRRRFTERRSHERSRSRSRSPPRYSYGDDYGGSFGDGYGGGYGDDRRAGRDRRDSYRERDRSRERGWRRDEDSRRGYQERSSSRDRRGGGYRDLDRRHEADRYGGYGGYDGSRR